MMRRWTLAVCLLLVLTPCIPVLADNDHTEARRLMESGSILPLEQILDSVRGVWPGRILEVELERNKGSYIYEIELLDAQGAVWELEIDAITGQLLKTKEED